MAAIAGIDAGGTHSRLAIEVDGRIQVRTEGPGARLIPGQAADNASSIAGLLRTAQETHQVPRINCLVVGAAGAGRDEPRGALRRQLEAEHLADTVLVTTDLEIALVAAFGLYGTGVLLMAGTGSAAIARLADGTVKRVGGHGWQMGDRGSGYAIGRAALDAIASAHDRTGPPTDLTARILNALHLDFPHLVSWASTATPTDVASLAPSVAASAGTDQTARAILDEAVQDLAALVTALLPNFPGDTLSLAMTGGLLGPEGRTRDRLLMALEQRALTAVLVPSVDPVLGALVLGKHASHSEASLG